MTDRHLDDPRHVLGAYERMIAARPDQDRLGEALCVMQEAHAGQTRRDPSVPYWVHPARVTMRLADWGAEPPLLVAGLLHDVLEDTDVGAGRIAREFGEQVLELVRAVTTPPRQASEHYRRLREAGPQARLLKLADRVDNLTSARVQLARTPSSRERSFARRYLERSRHETDPLLVGLASPVRSDYRRAVRELTAAADASGPGGARTGGR